ncbi:MAG: YraN family protein [Desulfamplus sp.]|nr:YraN family protein [Desulfamplus sp.]
MLFGQKAEDAAALFLEERGYKILERNYRTRFAEIDIIASHNEGFNMAFSQETLNQNIPCHNTLVFIEVKARNSKRYGLPSEAVPVSKQKKIVSAALHYLREHRIIDRRIRFDVVTILFNNGCHQIEIIPNAFEAL